MKVSMELLMKIDLDWILISGQKSGIATLAEFMIDYDVGITVEKNYPIKRNDMDYFPPVG
jgi:restriction endonuclease Mrr